MKEKYNFQIEPTEKTVSVNLPKSIFPVSVILHTAYLYIEKADIIVDERGEKVTVTFILDKEQIKEADLEKFALEFNKQLICVFVEETESRKHVGARDAMLRAALMPQGPRPPQTEKPGDRKGK